MVAEGYALAWHFVLLLLERLDMSCQAAPSALGHSRFRRNFEELAKADRLNQRVRVRDHSTLRALHCCPPLKMASSQVPDPLLAVLMSQAAMRASARHTRNGHAALRERTAD